MPAVKQKYTNDLYKRKIIPLSYLTLSKFIIEFAARRKVNSKPIIYKSLVVPPIGDLRKNLFDKIIKKTFNERSS